MSNIYSDPQDFGLETVGEFSLSESDYSFDIVVVFKDAFGQFYIAQDIGCSCPIPPFEDHTLDILEGPLDRYQTVGRLSSIAHNADGGYPSGASVELISRVRNG